ncbi:asparagine synthase (glutamine-hydrolyzing) [Pseudomonas sp. P9_31]|uniref:asparagine synthase (glutamine-hydrolyzing) n=1 Tax=Pseudomonas sp. P9_31 TaxID=3043448 RepID=UPI002A35E328|nr:asparagine synthase (glutamine-hydrolyzing) [Pseudomonas sp. P9_31]WPN60171.1 asparagine synthase (glutamine-hydrolyzing) [Pseudomonas sp. P9_31]
MCGIAGFMDLSGQVSADPGVLSRMLQTLIHRGPDAQGTLVEGGRAIGMRRLSIIDPGGSEQPLYNEDQSLALVGNGEIYNYIELREQLTARGHVFRTKGDMEVVLHLFEEFGADMTEHLNGQFSLALLDRRSGRLWLFRDPMGITPLHYAVFGDTLVFASEIKAILQHPAARRAIDPIGLDQVLCFPGLVSPRTLFKDVHSLPAGHRLVVDGTQITQEAFWDMDYPMQGAESQVIDEGAVVEQFLGLFDAAVKRRLRADVPVGLYLSGGLDSSFLAASVKAVAPEHELTTFSVVFPENRAINERVYQTLMVRQLGSRHIEIPFEQERIADLLHDMVWHSECPVKETYNTCTMAMSAAARAHGIPVVLGGEGADELLAGYPGYRFDAFSRQRGLEELSQEEAFARERLWGSSAVRYERHYGGYRDFRRRFLSRELEQSLLAEDCLSRPVIDVSKVLGRHPVNQRSYLDIKLRLADHLLGDHGDRMNMVSSIEGRFPFLDRDVVDLLRRLPPHLKLNGMDEKYLLKQAAVGRVPQAIIKREKFGFRAPGSSFLLAQNKEWIYDTLSPERIAREGFFDPAAIADELQRQKNAPVGANPHADDDILLFALTFSILLEKFDIKGL